MRFANKGNKGMANYTARGAELDFSAANAGGSQGLVRTVGLQGGGFGVSWIGSDSDRTMFDGDVFGLVYRSDLSSTTADAQQLITDTGPGNSYPVNQDLTDLQGGGFALVSTDDANYTVAQAASQRDVALRLYDSNGASLGEPVYLGSASVLGVTVTTLDNGRLVAGWVDTGGSLRAQYLSATGALLGESFVVAKPGSDIASRPEFSALSNGGWVATYVAQNQSDAHAVFFDAAGTPSSDTMVASDVTSLAGLQTHELADGRTLLLWSQQGQSQVETHAQLYTASGAEFGNELTLSTTASSVVSLTALADGGFAVAFEPAQSGDLEVRIYNSLGSENASPLTFASAIEPSISALADGGFVVAWKDSGTGEFHAQAYQANSVGDLTLTGTAADETLVGQEGNDTLNGLGGADQLFGSVGADHLLGGAGNDHLDGGAGNDVLDGGTGSDTMAGGYGDDTYFIDSSTDVVAEVAGAGTDTVIADTSYSLAAGSEVETLSTRGSSTTFAVDLTGNEFNNAIVGNASANRIDGGAGADVLYGYAGDDTYFVDNSHDVVVDFAGGGNDTIITTASYALVAGSEIELLRTTGSATTFAVDLTGNGFNNTLVGNTAANQINGGAGADAMYGYGGNDTYFVDNSGDLVVDIAGGGNDTIITTINYTLVAGSEIELLRTTGSATTYAVNLTGNEFNNTIVGNSAANIINGGGGADTLYGYGGDDSYYVDNPGDVVVETAGNGTDTIFASLNYTLAAGISVEQLRTFGSSTTNPVNLSGNEIDNTIVGNAAANTLHGGGGNDSLWGYGGNDTLFGDPGNDQFVITAGFGKDTVSDFAGNGAAAGDSIRFLAGTFSSFNDLMSHAAQQGSSVVFTLDANNSVTLLNNQLAALSSQDFIFG
jgi:Ca2+-binding RTX toxin-like protein